MVSEKLKKKYSRYLASGEEIVAVFGIGNKYFWMTLLGSIPLFLILYGFLRAARIIHLRHSRVYILTNRRVIVREGILTVNLTAAPYDKITHITVSEKFLQKITYGVGDITIHTAGPTPVEIDLVKVAKPVEIKNLIEELITKEKGGLISTEPSLVKKFI